MNVKLSANSKQINGSLQITGSKSESNRLLILKALYPNLEIENLSNSDDTKVLQKALNSASSVIDIHHAGTAMRFLTAYFSTIEGSTIELIGSSRMQERPIKILVDALRSLGASIEYLKENGFPPLQIKGKSLSGNQTELSANVSSQYISALMLIAPKLPSGLNIHLTGDITSKPYLEMTLSLLQQIGVKAYFEKNTIKISPLDQLQKKKIVVEPDWSSASYFYSLAALSDAAEIHLKNFRKQSLQGDSVLAELYQELGVDTVFNDEGIILRKKNEKNLPENFKVDLKETPDLAQTIAVTCLGLGIGCELSGLQTLKIKETDRLTALRNEMSKFGANINITEDFLHLKPCEKLSSLVEVETYQDHRMAMAFAPLALKTNLQIKNAEVVSKSFPNFWESLEKLQLNVEKTTS